jgi:hypothetical protein
MPKFQIVQYFQVTRCFVVDAENEDDALAKVDNGDVLADTTSGLEFSEDTIEQID